MVCVATLTPRKGHLVLPEALARLGACPCELRCAGSAERDAQAAAAVRPSVAAHALAGRAPPLGEPDGPGREAPWAWAGLCVSPARHGGYGMALAEAVARGLPVVAAAGGAVADTVPPQAGLLVPPGDAVALRQALARFM